MNVAELAFAIFLGMSLVEVVKAMFAQYLMDRNAKQHMEALGSITEHFEQLRDEEYKVSPEGGDKEDDE